MSQASEMAPVEVDDEFEPDEGLKLDVLLEAEPVEMVATAVAVLVLLAKVVEFSHLSMIGAAWAAAAIKAKVETALVNLILTVECGLFG